MNRRRTLLALPLMCAASHIAAQQPRGGKPKRIGLISDTPSKIPATEMPGWKPFWEALASSGWIVGKNLEYGPEFRDRDPGRLAALASKMVLSGVDLILTIDEEPTLAAARATKSIPILFGDVAWPLELGLIDSFARPGRNVTGVAQYAGLEMTIKRVGYLREVAPNARRLSWVHGDPSWSFQTLAGGRWSYADAVDADVKRLGFEPTYHLSPAQQDVARAFAAVANSGAQVLVATGGLPFERAAQLALGLRIPSAAHDRAFVEAGMLLSLGVTRTEQSAMLLRAASIANRLLRGDNPADVPVELPGRYELVINMKTAKAFGVTVPQSLLATAGELIQ